jgi:hypothetical protein
LPPVYRYGFQANQFQFILQLGSGNPYNENRIIGETSNYPKEGEQMRKPILSENFTIDDIHKLREYNYERRKNMTFEEYCADVKKGADRALSEMAALKQAKQLVTN